LISLQSHGTSLARNVRRILVRARICSI